MMVNTPKQHSFSSETLLILKIAGWDIPFLPPLVKNNSAKLNNTPSEMVK
jgi:hypothetical protein